MAKSLQAVIELSADPSGVIRGVAAANKELQRLNASAAATAMATQVSAGLNILQQVAGTLSSLYSSLDERLKYFENAALAYSPEAQRAAFQTEEVQRKADRQIGEAFAPTEQARQLLEQQRIKDDTKRTMGRIDEIGTGSLFLSEVGGGIKSGATRSWDSLLEGIGNVASGNFKDQQLITTLAGGDFIDALGATDALASTGLLERIANAIEGVDRKVGGQ